MNEKSIKNRPYVILHMLTSLDGKVTGTYLEGESCQEICEDYYKIHREYGAQGFICGRITMESSFTGQKRPNLDEFKGVSVKRCDHVAKKSDFYAVSIDPRGLVGWYASDISDPDEGYDGAHIIEVLSEGASDEYLAYLDKIGASYIFCGEKSIDVSLMCERLYSLFGIEKILLEGGGKTNTAFLEQDLIDEISLVMSPQIDTDPNGIDLFSGKSGEAVNGISSFGLEDVKRLNNSALWVKYIK